MVSSHNLSDSIGNGDSSSFKTDRTFYKKSDGGKSNSPKLSNSAKWKAGAGGTSGKQHETASPSVTDKKRFSVMSQNMNKQMNQLRNQINRQKSKLTSATVGSKFGKKFGKKFRGARQLSNSDSSGGSSDGILEGAYSHAKNKDFVRNVRIRKSITVNSPSFHAAR